MKTLKLLIITTVLMVCYSFKHSQSIEKIKVVKSTELIGKTGVITFPNFTVEETFLSESKLHWKIVDDKGNVTEEDEEVSFKKIDTNSFFISWIEKSGLTVSQVINIKEHKVNAFVSNFDEKSDRGKRSANFLSGTIEFKK